MVAKSSRKSKEERFSFARIVEPMEMPYLLETQKLSYSEFLQMNVPPDAREDKGLHEIFKSIFPVKAPNHPSTLEFVEYSFG